MRWRSSCGRWYSSPSIIKPEIIMGSSNSISWDVHWRMERTPADHICKPLFVAASFTITKKWETQMPFDKWMGIQNMVYHSRTLFSLKKGGNAGDATTGMNLEDIILSETGQSQKNTCCMIPFTWGPERRYILTESRMVGDGLGVKRGGESVLNVYQVPVWEDEEFLEMGSGDGFRTIGMYLMPQNYTG